MKSDLFAQLRGYGQQIQEDLVAAEPPIRSDPPSRNDSDTSTVPVAAEPIRTRQAEAAQNTVRPPRSRWYGALLAAASVTVIAILAQLLPGAAPTRPAQARIPGEEMTIDGSRTAIASIATGICILATACSDSGATNNATTTTMATTVSEATSVADSPPPLFGDRNASTVEPGTYLIDHFNEPIAITVPAGWGTDDFWLAKSKVFIGFWPDADTLNVATNACDGNVSGVGPSAADFVAGMVAQTGTDTSTPTTRQIAGLDATELEVSTTEDVASCAADHVKLWSGAWISAPGETWRIYAFDLNGKRAVISVGMEESPDSAVKAEVEGMIDSLTIS